MAALSSSLVRTAVVLVLFLVVSQQFHNQHDRTTTTSNNIGSGSSLFVSAQTGGGGSTSGGGGSIFEPVIYAIMEIFAFLKLRTIGPSCKPLPFIPDFDLNRFIAKSWYVQRKQVNEYQDYSELNCITETYDFYPEGELTSDLYKLQMKKYLTGQGGTGVFGTPFLVDWMCLTPFGKGGQFKNAPCLFPGFLKFLGGPYYVVKTDYDNYAIIVGGDLSERGLCDDTSGLCTVPIRGEIIDPGSWFGQRQGLYFFTRLKDPPASVMATMEILAKSMGICTASMLDVVHEGCTYAGAGLKV